MNSNVLKMHIKNKIQILMCRRRQRHRVLSSLLMYHRNSHGFYIVPIPIISISSHDLSYYIIYQFKY